MIETVSRRCVLYLRLSASADESVSIARQESELRGHAEREGWAVTHVLVDDGISGTKARENAKEALRLVRDGEADVLLVWALDRFSRQGLGAVAELVDTLDAAPGSLFVALKDGLRSDMAMWRVIAVVLAEVARAEAENVSARRRSEVAFRRGLGRHTTGSAPFGYRAVPAPDGIGQTLVIDPDEAALIRRLADEVLGGASLTRIAKELSDRRIPTGRSEARAAARRGQPTDGLKTGFWEVTTLKRLLSSDRLLGRLMHDGQPVTGDDGLPIQFYEPILGLDEIARLRSRLRPGAQPNVRKVKASRLLSGVAVCAHCGGYLRVTGRRGVPVYRCYAYGRRDCPSPSAPAAALEAAVVSAVLTIAGDWPEVAEVTEDGTAAVAVALAEVEAAIQETTQALGRDGANIPALLSRLDTLKERRTALRDGPVPAAAPEVVLTGRTLSQAFHASDEVAWRRSVILWALDHVTVSKALRQTGPRFDTDRVGYAWNAPAADDLDGASRGPQGGPRRAPRNASAATTA